MLGVGHDGTSMRVFLSYASEDRQLAEEIQLSLVGEGHKVFFDAETLPPGGDYQSRIREAVAGSDCLIFLISPESVAAKSYALTELGYARAKWPHPRGRVVPVIGRHTDFASIPPYLKAVTILEPKGNLAAEVSLTIAKLHPHAANPQDATPPNAGQSNEYHAVGLRANKLPYYARIASIIVASGIVVAILVNAMGQLGSFVTHSAYPPNKDVDDIPNGGIAYIDNRAYGYEKAVEMIRTAGRSKQNHILNLRTTQSNPEQDKLYKEIVAALSGSHIQYTRVLFYEADTKLENIRWFLKELGQNSSFRLQMILDTGGLPSCVITDRAALIGFNDGFGRLSNSLYVEKPLGLVRDIRDTYTRVIERGHTIMFKDFEERIGNDEIDKLIASKEQEIKKATELLKAVREHIGPNKAPLSDAPIAVRP
jgi:hypothetical protein